MSESRARYAQAGVAITSGAGLVITPMNGADGGEYVLDIVCAQNVTLQALAADGVTQRTVTTVNAPGGVGAAPIKVGQGSILKLVPAADAPVSYSLSQVL